LFQRKNKRQNEKGLDFYPSSPIPTHKKKSLGLDEKLE
jgi:hypothetical protein